jgi:predicted nucleotidyltransferase
MTLPERIEAKKQAILETAARHGIRNVRIFGSMARGEATEQSDIDFLVEVEPGRGLLDLGGFYADIQDLLGCPVDVVTERGVSKYIRQKVLTEARPL